MILIVTYMHDSFSPVLPWLCSIRFYQHAATNIQTKHVSYIER